MLDQPWTLTPAQLHTRAQGRKMPPPRIEVLLAAVRKGWSWSGVDPNTVCQPANGIGSGGSADAEILDGLTTEADGLQGTGCEGSQSASIVEHA
jgi:hypothetical protein